MMECCDRCGGPVDRTKTGIAMAMSAMYAQAIDMHDPDAEMMLCHKCFFALDAFLKGAELVNETEIVNKRMGVPGDNDE